MIAAINGIAAGAGVRDRAARPTSACWPARRRFAFLFTKVGLAGRRHGLGIPAAAHRRARPRHRAAPARRQGRRRDARYRIGLANAVVDDDELPARRRELWPDASPTAPRSPTRRPRCCSPRELDMDLAGSIELEALTQALLMKSHDHARVLPRLDRGARARMGGTMSHGPRDRHRARAGAAGRLCPRGRRRARAHRLPRRPDGARARTATIVGDDHRRAVRRRRRQRGGGAARRRRRARATSSRCRSSSPTSPPTGQPARARARSGSAISAATTRPPACSA